MTLTRRRFLTISAAFATAPGAVHAESWQGSAFGADVALTIRGPQGEAAAAVQEARALIVEVERLFSLYDPSSALSVLNQTGVLDQPASRFSSVMRAADLAYRQTGGLFDPTVQPLWHALARNSDVVQAAQAIGWDRVHFDASEVRLGTGQALTFNGIAQGYATDLVADALTARGLTDTLVNIGEYRAAGGPWRLGVEDPQQGHLGNRTLRTGAIATSSPAATMLGVQSHILHASARPQWSTVSVEAPRATVADSLSTAMVLADRDQIDRIRSSSDVTRVTLVDFDGNLVTL